MESIFSGVRCWSFSHDNSDLSISLREIWMVRWVFKRSSNLQLVTFCNHLVTFYLKK